MGYKLITGPSSEPISTTEAKLHLKIETSDTTEDTLLTMLIQMAREQVETYTRRALITQTWELQMDDFDGIDFRLERTPVISITSVKYYDLNGVEQTLSSSYYTLYQGDEPHRILLNDGYLWPDCRGMEGDVKIKFQAGYGAASAVPASLKYAMLLMIGHLYEHREDVVIGRQVNALTKGSEDLMRPFRLFTV